MGNKDQEKKTDQGSEKSKKETIEELEKEEREKEEREKQNARLAERKGQRKAFPFKRGSI